MGMGPTALTLMLDDPEDILPPSLPQADLLLVLTESTMMTHLVSDLAELCSAQAIIVAVDRRPCAPPGLVGQVRRRLQTMGIDSAWPMPFCSLAPTPGQHPLIQEFAQRYGRPELACTIQDNKIASCQIVREAPCGNTRYIVSQLAGVETSQAAEQCGLLHHYYPCWGGMETDPVQGTHTLLHIAATMAQKSIQRALRSATLRSATLESTIPVKESEVKGETDDDTKRA
jgi:thymidylate synthase